MVGLVLRTQSGDWEGLYVNGCLISEGHELDNVNDWITWTNEYGLTSVKYKELNDEDDEDISIIGSFYKYLDEFKGDYGKG